MLLVIVFIVLFLSCFLFYCCFGIWSCCRFCVEHCMIWNMVLGGCVQYIQIFCLAHTETLSCPYQLAIAGNSHPFPNQELPLQFSALQVGSWLQKTQDALQQRRCRHRICWFQIQHVVTVFEVPESWKGMCPFLNKQISWYVFRLQTGHQNFPFQRSGYNLQRWVSFMF